MRDDLDRFLDDRPILATPPTAWKRVRRNSVLLGLAAASVVVTLGTVTAVLAVSRRELADKQAATQKALDGETKMREELDWALAGKRRPREAERCTAYAHTLAYAVARSKPGNWPGRGSSSTASRPSAGIDNSDW